MSDYTFYDPGVPTLGSITSSYTSTTTTSPWSASTDPQMVKAWMSAVIERLEHLQQRIRELEGERRG
jgi:hypothetical protein